MVTCRMSPSRLSCTRMMATTVLSRVLDGLSYLLVFLFSFSHIHPGFSVPTVAPVMPTVIYAADFESNSGDNAWIFLGGAADGDWIIGQPTPYVTIGTQMEIAAFQGNQALVTGINNSQDVDGGPTTARSPNITLDANASSIEINFQYYFSHYTNATSDDNLVVSIHDATDNSVLATIVTEVGSGLSRDALYQSYQQSLLSYAGNEIYIQVSSQDISNGSKVEAAIDAIQITQEVVDLLSCGNLISDDFEGGFGNWTDGGSDCTLFNDSALANSGDFSIRLRDNTSTSVMTTGPFDLSNVDELQIDFSYIVVSFEGTEDFWFQTSSDGTTFNTEQIWTRTIDFENDIRENESFMLSGPFSATTYFRFRADASGNADLVYLDDIFIDTCSVTIMNPVTNQGSVFYDYNNNGVFDGDDYGLDGIIVEAYDDNGLVESVVTDINGEYMFNTLSDITDYRIEFSNYPTDHVESTIGDQSNSSVQFRRASMSDPLTLGLIDPFNVCDVDPYLVLPCYVEGSYNGSNANEYAFVKVLQSADGHDFNGTSTQASYEAQPLVNHSDIGSVYGVAWQKTSRRLYTSAFYKRYVGFGPNGPDAIYQMDLDGNVTGVIELDVLTNTTNSAGADSHNFTPVNGHVYDLGGSDDGFNHVGKRSFGDIEMSDDMDTLFVVNLFDKKVYAIDVSDPNTTNATVIDSWNAPDATGSGRHRPFGLAYDKGQLYVGSVDDDGSSAFVHTLNRTNGNSVLQLSFSLAYDRQSFFGNADNPATSAEWQPWATSTNIAPLEVSDEIALPQAILSDIEFDRDGNMIIGLRDRFGDQVGADKFYSLTSSSTTWGISSGDILKSCNTANGFIIETGIGGACPVNPALDDSGPGGVEFYHWDIFALEQNVWDPYNNTGAFHWEIAQGALYQPPGAGYVITIASDPFDDFSGGFLKFDNTSGTRLGTNGTSSTTANLSGGYTIYESGDFDGTLPTGTFTAGKANGLGDIEASCNYSIQIGNYVWFDQDLDGIQDPSLSLIHI